MVVLAAFYAVLYLCVLLLLTAGGQLMVSSSSFWTTETDVIFLGDLEAILRIQGQKFLTFTWSVHLGFVNPRFAALFLGFSFLSCFYKMDAMVGVTFSDRGCRSHPEIHFCGLPSHWAQQRCRLFCFLKIPWPDFPLVNTHLLLDNWQHVTVVHLAQ